MKEITRIKASTINPSYYHSFAVTDQHLVFLEMSLKLNLLKLLTAQFTRRPFSASMEYYPDVKVCHHV